MNVTDESTVIPFKPKPDATDLVVGFRRTRKVWQDGLRAACLYNSKNKANLYRLLIPHDYSGISLKALLEGCAKEEIPIEKVKRWIPELIWSGHLALVLEHSEIDIEQTRAWSAWGK